MHRNEIASEWQLCAQTTHDLRSENYTKCDTNESTACTNIMESESEMRIERKQNRFAFSIDAIASSWMRVPANVPCVLQVVAAVRAHTCARG